MVQETAFIHGDGIMLFHPGPVGFNVFFRGAGESFEYFAVSAEGIIFVFLG